MQVDPIPEKMKNACGLKEIKKSWRII